MRPITKQSDPLKNTLSVFRKDLASDLAEQTKNIINESLADFRMSLNKDMEKFATKEDIARLEDSIENRPTHQDLADAVRDVVDAMDKINLEHLSKHHHVSL